MKRKTHRVLNLQLLQVLDVTSPRNATNIHSVVQLHPYTLEHIAVNSSHSRTDPILQFMKINW